MKTCVTCRHLFRERIDPPDTYLCTRIALPACPVTGRPRFDLVVCQQERAAPDSFLNRLYAARPFQADQHEVCGLEGKFWEANGTHDD